MEPGTCTLNLRVWLDKENPVVLFADHLFTMGNFTVVLFGYNGEQDRQKKLRVKFENVAAIPVAALNMETPGQVLGKLVFTDVKYEVLEWDVSTTTSQAYSPAAPSRRWRSAPSTCASWPGRSPRSKTLMFDSR
jgi:hypothetical protein